MHCAPDLRAHLVVARTDIARWSGHRMLDERTQCCEEGIGGEQLRICVELCDGRVVAAGKCAPLLFSRRREVYDKTRRVSRARRVPRYRQLRAAQRSDMLASRSAGGPTENSEPPLDGALTRVPPCPSIRAVAHRDGIVTL